MEWLKKQRERLLVLSVMVMMLTPAIVQAAWPVEPATNLAITDRNPYEADPVAVPDGSGGVIAVWREAGTYRILAQRISADGIPLWTPNGILLGSNPDAVSAPRAVSDGAGGAIVTWSEGSGVGYDICAQRVSDLGVPLWGPDGITVCGVPNNQVNPNLTTDDAGGAIIAWEDVRTGNFDIYAQRVDPSGALLWPVTGVAICTAAANQTNPLLVPDGASGAIIVWTDLRNGSADLYAQRISAGGVVQWAANGAPVCDAAGIQQYASVATDGAGGAVVAWMDYRTDGGDVYAQRINVTGQALWAANGLALCTAAGIQSGVSAAQTGGAVVVSWTDDRNGSSNRDIFAQRVTTPGVISWAANGVAVSAATGNQSVSRIIPDMGGGSIVVWEDKRGGTYSDLYAQRLYSTGTPQWAANGVAVSTGPNNQSYPVAASDYAYGAIFVWVDGRSGGDIYSQLVRSGGEIGNLPPPTLLRVTDVPSDQGGKVQIEWGGSSKDCAPSYAIESYSVWRRVPNAQAASSIPLASSVSGTGLTAGPGKQMIQTAGAGGQAMYWEYLATLPARGFLGYSYVAETTSDSLAGSNPYTSFMVLAEEAGGTPYYASEADSGYSVDNLSPGSPGPFGGQYVAGAVRLHWSPNMESDLAGYRLYEGSSADFIPSAGNLICAATDTSYADVGQPGSYYKLSAVDLHGNESEHALLSPAQITAVDEAGAASQIRFRMLTPNPSGGQAMFRLDLPRDSEVRFAIYDVRGRMVQSVASGRRSSGPHVFQWNAGGSGSPVSSGVYFARLEVDGKVAGTRRVTVVR